MVFTPLFEARLRTRQRNCANNGGGKYEVTHATSMDPGGLKSREVM
jgi:hypothetical protein